MKHNTKRHCALCDLPLPRRGKDNIPEDQALCRSCNGKINIVIANQQRWEAAAS